MALTAIFTGPVASAHATRVSAQPADNAALATGPDRVSATFNERLQTTFAAMTVVGPDGNLWSTGETSVQGAVVGVGLRPLGPAGTYTVNYRVTICRRPRGVRVLVVSADGGRDRHTRTRRRWRQYRRRRRSLAVRGGSSGTGRRGRVVDGMAQA